MYIRQIQVRNFRSLRDVTIGGLSKFVVLYGENDTGKSNILSFLDNLFREKLIEQVTRVGEKEELTRQPGGFWRGELEGFTDNFFRDSTEPITFSVLVRFERTETEALSLPPEFVQQLSKSSRFDHLQLDGRIERLPAERAQIVLTKARFDQKDFYDADADEDKRYLPGYKLESGQALDTFERIMRKLTNCFRLVPAARFLTSETEAPRAQAAPLGATSFKNWIFQQNLDRNAESTFRLISQRFNEPPFQHGRVSIARVAESEIEVFVEDARGLKLPVGRKGSGVQQILIVLAHVAESKAPLIGVEELEINLAPRTQAAIFNSLFQLVNSPEGPIGQVLLTSHSPHIARRDEAERRVVTMEAGETKVAKPSAGDVTQFFKFPLPDLDSPRRRRGRRGQQRR